MQSNIVLDNTPPSTPSGTVTAIAVSASQIDLTWGVSTDSGTLVGYKVYRDGAFRAYSATLAFSDSTGLSHSTQYCYTISASR